MLLNILESLEKKGFVIMKLGKPIKYIAVPPTEVVDRVKKNVKNNANEAIKRLDTLKDTEILTELNTLHTQGIELVEPTDLAGSMKGRHNLYNHLELTIRNAEETVTIMTTTQGLVRKIEGLKPVFRLTPPSKGFKGKKNLGVGMGGITGYRGEDINSLALRMI